MFYLKAVTHYEMTTQVLQQKEKTSAIGAKKARQQIVADKLEEQTQATMINSLQILVSKLQKNVTVSQISSTTIMMLRNESQQQTLEILRLKQHGQAADLADSDLRQKGGPS